MSAFAPLVRAKRTSVGRHCRQRSEDPHIICEGIFHKICAVGRPTNGRSIPFHARSSLLAASPERASALVLLGRSGPASPSSGRTGSRLEADRVAVPPLLLPGGACSPPRQRCC